MILKYLVGGKPFVADGSNGDLDISRKTDGDRVTVTLRAKKDIILKSAIEKAVFKVDRKNLFFTNGYQSWTDTKEARIFETEKNIYKAPHLITLMYGFDKPGDAKFYRYRLAKLHGFDVFYTKGKKEKFVFSVNKDAYLIIELRKIPLCVNLISDIDGAKLSAGEEFTLFDYYSVNGYEDGLKVFDGVFPKTEREKIFGYTTWYNYYQNINQKIVLRDLDALDNRFNLFQIDDGYQTAVGDWKSIDKTKFPDGLKGTVDKIHAKGLKAGIWLAPFVAEKNSEIFQKRPDLFKKNLRGVPYSAGSNWSGFYPFDMDNPEARQYIKDCLTYFMDLGFDFFKLDFLFAVSAIPSAGKTRCQTANESYAFLREVLKDKLILGCGATLFNAAKIFDYMRIGPDVSLIFDDVAYMRMFHRERISTKVTLKNTVYRSFMDGRLFGNDPDVFLLRDDNIELSDAQKLSLITINSLFGSVLMTSDNIGEYDEKKKKRLEYALALYNRATVSGFERKGKKIVIRYEIDGEQKQITYHTGKGVLL